MGNQLPLCKFSEDIVVAGGRVPAAPLGKTAAQPGVRMCAAPWCSHLAEPDLPMCRLCLVRLYERAPEAVEALYDACTPADKREALRVFTKALKVMQPGLVRPLDDGEMALADELARSLTCSASFLDLLHARNGTPEGYRPCLYVWRRPRLKHPGDELRHRNLALANLYDRAQICRGDPRRSVRS